MARSLSRCNPLRCRVTAWLRLSSRPSGRRGDRGRSAGHGNPYAVLLFALPLTDTHQDGKHQLHSTGFLPQRYGLEAHLHTVYKREGPFRNGDGNRGRTRMTLPKATFLSKTGRYERAASLCLGTLSSAAIGNQALRGCSVATVRTRIAQLHRAFPFRKRHSTLTPIVSRVRQHLSPGVARGGGKAPEHHDG